MLCTPLYPPSSRHAWLMFPAEPIGQCSQNSEIAGEKRLLFTARWLYYPTKFQPVSSQP